MELYRCIGDWPLLGADAKQRGDPAIGGEAALCQDGSWGLGRRPA